MMIHGWTTCIRSYIMHRALSSPMQCIVRYPHPCSASFDRCPHPGSASFDRCPHLHVAYHTSIVHHTSVAYRTSIAYHTSIVYHTSIYTSASLDRWHHSCDASFFIRSVSAPTRGISFIDRIIHRLHMIHRLHIIHRLHVIHRSIVRSLSSPRQCFMRSVSAPTCGISYIDRTSYIDYISLRLHSIECISYIDQHQRFVRSLSLPMRCFIRSVSTCHQSYLIHRLHMIYRSHHMYRSVNVKMTEI